MYIYFPFVILNFPEYQKILMSHRANSFNSFSFFVSLGMATMQPQQGSPGPQILQAGSVNAGDQTRSMAPMISMTEIQQQAMMQTLPGPPGSIAHIMPNGTVSMIPPVSSAQNGALTSGNTLQGMLTTSATHQFAAGTQTLKDESVIIPSYHFDFKE